jgi:NitT/TauT family transport system substrate-binding protein
MKKNYINQHSIGLVLLLSLLTAILVSACSAQSQEQSPGDNSTIRFAALRILDALPLYVAVEQGYFEEAGITVEILPVNSATERDQLIASNQADGMINEVMSTLYANRDEVRVKIVRTARAADEEHRVFSILAGQDSGATSIEDLRPFEIGISQGTIIEYVTDRLLEAEGYNPDEFTKVNIPSIPDRLALLNSGELVSATLPEPATSLATGTGAVIVIDDSAHPQYGYSTIAFREAFISENPELIRSFLEAYEKAILEINQNPERWNTTLVDKELIPAPLAGNYPVPPFITASVPSIEQFEDAIGWALAKGLISEGQSYPDQITAEFLP